MIRLPYLILMSALALPALAAESIDAVSATCPLGRANPPAQTDDADPVTDTEDEESLRPSARSSTRSVPQPGAHVRSRWRSFLPGMMR